MKHFLLAAILSLFPCTLFALDSPSFRGGSEHPGVYDSAAITHAPHCIASSTGKPNPSYKEG